MYCVVAFRIFFCGCYPLKTPPAWHSHWSMNANFLKKKVWTLNLLRRKGKKGKKTAWSPYGGARGCHGPREGRRATALPMDTVTRPPSALRARPALPPALASFLRFATTPPPPQRNANATLLLILSPSAPSRPRRRVAAQRPNLVSQPAYRPRPRSRSRCVALLLRPPG
jgi:hypothetical protein